jgi:hypothetical protein
MSTDGFTLYSTVHISREEYMNWLHQLNAVLIPEEGGAYDARLSKDVRHVWISLLEQQWFDMTMVVLEEDLPEVLAKICQLLGGEPRSAIVLTANDVEGSQILAVQFAALCAEHYSCVVMQSAGQGLFSAQEVLELRDMGMGFDGSTWATAQTTFFDWNARIIEEAQQLEDAKKRAQQEANLSDQEKRTPDRSEGLYKEQLEA